MGLRTEVRYFFGKRHYPKTVSGPDTIDYIVENRASLCRFGDGEFSLIFGKSIRFQNENKKLGERLHEIILAGSTPKTMIAITDIRRNAGLFRKSATRFWKRYIGRKAKYLKELFKGTTSRKYYDAFITRPYACYSEKGRKKSAGRFENIKRLWDGRDVLIVEGEQSRFGVGNDLLEGAKSVKRILAPAKHAFDVYDRIVETTLAELDKSGNDVLILTVLGPTATVLSYDLAQKGFQSVDIGHLDIEYEWFLRQADQQIPVPGKYVNEAGGPNTDELDPKTLEKYRESIVATVK